MLPDLANHGEAGTAQEVEVVVHGGWFGDVVVEAAVAVCDEVRKLRGGLDGVPLGLPLLAGGGAGTPAPGRGEPAVHIVDRPAAGHLVEVLSVEEDPAGCEGRYLVTARIENPDGSTRRVYF
ncbi:hypothetical protein [Nocardioides sp. AX2bis]|uniref:hypothetical protein n=1 Tax=Nocardioides sp. AX2bis TaxID=2653157 RepID=UPI0012F1A3CC|nr:hypothetical protein [Nocardioides sp. AX2bis]VXC54135.1 hypothetical protein NOCARDAX2BIS_830006 [Nocardioides sp. AX2bis]